MSQLRSELPQSTGTLGFRIQDSLFTAAGCPIFLQASVRYEIPAGNSQWNFNHTQLRNPSSKPGASDRSKFLDTNARIERSFQDKADPEGGRGRERESEGEHQSVSPR